MQFDTDTPCEQCAMAEKYWQFCCLASCPKLKNKARKSSDVSYLVVINHIFLLFLLVSYVVVKFKMIKE